MRISDWSSDVCSSDLFSAAVVWGGYNEARDKLLRWETFGTAWDPPIPATMKPLVLLVVVLIAVQAVTNLIRDWNKEKEVHDLVERSEEHTSELQSLMRISYAVFCLKKKKQHQQTYNIQS